MSLEFLSAYASQSLSLVNTHALVCVHHSVHVAGDLIVEVLVYCHGDSLRYLYVHPGLCAVLDFGVFEEAEDAVVWFKWLGVLMEL